MRTLYFPTSLHFLDDRIERQLLFVFPILKGKNIFCVFGETEPDSFVDQFRHTSIGFRSLKPERPMKSRVKIYCGAFV